MWIQKLTEKELLELHRYVFMNDTSKIEVSEDDDRIAIDAYENWPYEDGSPAYIPTFYEYMDFDYKCYDTSDYDHEETAGRYREFLCRKFGIKYLHDMVKECLHLDVNAIMEVY